MWLYRVHRSSLNYQSKFFADMFTLPPEKPALTAAPQINDLQDDIWALPLTLPEKAFETVLLAIYDP
jgi:hypothetical protein